MSRFLSIVLVALACIAVAGDVLHAQPGNRAAAKPALEEGVITAMLYGIARRDLVTYFDNDTLYVPFRGIAELIGIIHRISENVDTVYGELPTGNPFQFVVSDHTFRRRSQLDTLAPNAIRVIDGEVYIEREALDTSIVLGSSFDINLLQLTISPVKTIPAVMVKQAMRKYAALHENDGSAVSLEAASSDVKLRRSLYGPIALDWGLGSSTVSAVSMHTGNLNVTTPFLYGVLGVRGRAGLRGEAGAQVDARLDGLSWRFELPELPFLSSLSLGMTPTGASSSYTVGIGGSTRSTDIPTYGTREITGDAGPGWWVELRDGALLLDAVRVGDDGRYSFEVPMVGTRMIRTIKMLGPQGQRQSEMRTLAVSSDMLPQGDVRWNAGATTYEQWGLRVVSGSARITAGLFDRMTVDVSTSLPASVVTKISPDSLRFSLSARLALFDASTVNISFDPHSYRFGTSFGISAIDELPIRIRLDSVDVVQKTFDATLNTRFAIGDFRFSSVGRYINRWNRSGYEITPTVSTTLFDIGLMAAVRGGRIKEYRGYGEQRQTVVKTRADLRLQASLPSLWRMRLRLGMTYDLLTDLIGESNASLSFPLFRIFSVSASYGFRGTDWKNGTFGAGLSMSLPFARGGVSGSYFDGRTSMYSRLNGGMVISPAGIEITNDFASSRIHLYIRGYHDKNANGTYDGDDVMLGPAESDLTLENGVSIGSGSSFKTVPAMRNCVLRVNPEQFAGDGLYPLKSRFTIAMPSGSSEVIDIPFASGSDLYGEAVINMPSGNRGRPAALFGVKVRLVSLDGSAEYESEFINDGTYLLTGVAHGEYRLLVDETELVARGLELESIPETIVIGDGTESLPRITLVPIGSGNATQTETDEWVD